VEGVPRLSESLVGKQEAALRWLLQQFREGNLEQALRRALPLNSPARRGASPGSDDRLPVNKLLYNLRELLGGGGGRVSVWVGAFDVQAELAREYRKAAEEATGRGDYRRAAFIYGKLLHDYRLAASVLARGGLHHDAAVLYLDKLGDTPAAAREFEAAGEIDRALQLYRQRGDHAAAGDLLQRAGEEEQALEEYRLAAAQLAVADNLLAAGDLMAGRARRPDLAVEFLAAGWGLRPRGTALGCLLRLAELRAAEESPRALLALADEADAFLGPPGNENGAAQFYNALAVLAGRGHLAGVRDELRDRALVGLANKLRQRAQEEARPGHAVSTLLGQSAAWPAALVSDADFAFRAAVRKPPGPRAAPAHRVRLAQGEVTAACAAAETGRVFVGFASGEWASFDPQVGGQHPYYRTLELPASAVLSLATNRRGSTVVVLYAPTPDGQLLESYAAFGNPFTRRQRQFLPQVPPQSRAWLTPIAEHAGQAVLGLWYDGRLAVLWANDLVPVGEIRVSPDPEPDAALLHVPAGSGTPPSGFLLAGSALYTFSGNALRPHPDTVWQAGASGAASVAPRDWRVLAGRLEIAGVDGDGVAQWAEVGLDRPWQPDHCVRAVGASSAYLAAALLGPGHVAAVRRGGVDWLRRDRHQLVPWSATALDLAAATACFFSPLTGELLVVCRDGWLVRVPVPH
jgi:hypothetical protein